MNTFLRFFYEFISIFFDGFFLGLKGMWAGLSKMFGFTEYAKLISNYKDKFNGNEKIFLIICIVFLLIFIAVFTLLFVLMIKELMRKFGKYLNNDELLEEIGSLNDQVVKLMKEKDELMAMKVSQLGINPDGEDNNKKASNSDLEDDEEVIEVGVRFPSLVKIDEAYKNYKVKNYENNFTLQEFIDDFRCFSASQLGLYYDFTILRPFIAGLACGKLIILQGISGTGKTSLAYAWGKFVKNDSCVTSVEPSWREKTDFLGYFNEFSKKFNETRSLEEIYRAGYDDDVHTIILDEMNLARVEYYFADLLSILEIPNKEEWLVDIVTDSWPKDPKNIVNGKLRLPENLWYIGTINNDDSTFMVTDKVYDRAMPIDINTKIEPFKCREQESVNVNASYLYSLFNEAMEKYPLSPKGEQQIRDIDDYVIKHFRIAFGNRIMKQIKTFSSVYVACGGKEIEAIDYFIAKKILRKFEQLSVAFIRDEIDPFISYLNKNMGKDVMKECIEYLERIKKSI
jgi:hypothetical protein